MKTLLFTFLFTLSELLGIACSCSHPTPFCYNRTNNSDPILVVVKLGGDSLIDSLGGLSKEVSFVKVIANIRGGSVGDTLSIWNSEPYNSCARSLEHLAYGDTLIINPYSSSENNPGIEGFDDYELGAHPCSTIVLRVQGDTVRGNYVIPRDRYTKYWHFNIQYDKFLVAFDTCTVEIGPITSVVEVQGQKAFHVYPNPTEDFISIINTRAEPFIFTLFDVHGRIVDNEATNDGKTLRIRLPEIPGMYWIQFEQDSKIEYVRILRK